MTTIVYSFTDETATPLELPGNLRSLSQFRKWVFSDSFPETGRIDYIAGRIEVDMAADDLFTHNLSKTELVRNLANFVKSQELGWLFCDGARVSCPEADLSVEPDVVFVSHESRDLGTVNFRRSKSQSHAGYVEIVGPPDLVVEVVSDSSVRKDTQLLTDAYYSAGVKEYWLIDCRRNQLNFDLLVRGPRKFRAVKVTAGGLCRSQVFQANVRFTRQLAAPELWEYDLEILK